MICSIFTAIEITEAMEKRMRFGALSMFQGFAVPAFCRSHVGRLLRIASQDPKHRDLYRSCAEFLVRLHKKFGPGNTSEGELRRFRENCEAFGIT